MALIRPRAFGVAHHRIVADVAHLLFAAHQLDIAFLPAELGVQRLDRHNAPRNKVLRAVDLAGTAAPDHTLDLVGVVQDLATVENVARQGFNHRLQPPGAGNPDAPFKTVAAKSYLPD